MNLLPSTACCIRTTPGVIIHHRTVAWTPSTIHPHQRLAAPVSSWTHTLSSRIFRSWEGRQRIRKMSCTPDVTTAVNEKIRLTQFSHGAGCGCKISPKNLEELLRSEIKSVVCPQLIVGHETKDDAAVYDIGHGMGVVSTTDFFMPIVDDSTDFGRIAATNAISDVYAMGGTPIMAIAILGFPIDKLPLSVAMQIVEGGRLACNNAGIPLSGGHSIDAPEPIFGLAVTGLVHLDKLKKNSTALHGCKLYLTKPIGIGILTTAEKKGVLKHEDVGKATSLMCQLNRVGVAVGQIDGVTAMTDVTGFGLLGHLLEMCEGSHVRARLTFEAIPTIEGIEEYINLRCCPGGTSRNYESYGSKVRQANGRELTSLQQSVLCDPQTSGGLLIAVQEGHAEKQLIELFKRTEGVGPLLPIGRLEEQPLDSGKESSILVFVESIEC